MHLTERLFLSLPGDRRPGPETGTETDAMAPLVVPADLRGIIGQALSYREDVPAESSAWERVLPDGGVRIVIDLSPSASLPRIVVLGPRTTPALVRLSGRMEGLSLRLSRTASMAVLGVPVGEVADRALPLAELRGASGGGTKRTTARHRARPRARRAALGRSPHAPGWSG